MTLSVGRTLREDLLAAVDRHVGRACELRREIHRFPDLSGAEAPTRSRLLEALPAGGHVTQVAETGAIVRFGGPGPSVALRAELDALPIHESTGVAWESERPGLMHACGHDVNMAALVGVVHAICDIGLTVPVCAVLQPREETLASGARDVIASGALRAAEASMIVSAHLQPVLPPGTVSCTPGAVNASADEFTITVRGTGGHAAYPHLVDDTVVAMSHVVVALQSMMARTVDPLSPAVLSIGAISGGRGPNVLPDGVQARGTLRTMSERDRVFLHARMDEICRTIASAHGCEATVSIQDGEPVLVNDAALAAATGGGLASLGLEVVSDLRTMGADDFAFFGDHVPALMMFVGVDTGGASLHSAELLPGDVAVRHSMLALAAGYLAGVERLSAAPE